MIDLYYKDLCPNCGGTISSQRLAQGLMCERCMPQAGDPCEVLQEGEYLKICKISEQEKLFEEFFKHKNGFALRQIQHSWAKRFFLGHSFALLAPTGVGKTTFGLSLAAFLKINLKTKSYLLFPTQLLVNQAVERVQKLGIEPVYYDSRLSKKQRDEAKRRIFEGEFDILITTTNFMYKNFNNIPKEFGFVFIDDVDSILKSARNIDKVMMLLGFSQKDIDRAMEFIDLKSKRALKPEEFTTWQEQIKQIRTHAKAQLIVSSATANPKSRRVGLFRELLGFEVSRPSLTIRNVEDIYEEPQDIKNRAVELLKKFGNGGLVFLPGNKKKENLQEFVEFLEQKGIKAQSYEKFDVEAYRRGDVQVLVGFASYRNPLARGIDMPDIIRYALFVGVPKLEFYLDLTKHSTLYYFLLALIGAIKGEPFFDEVVGFVKYLEKVYRIPAERLTQKAKEHISAIYRRINEILTDTVIKKINQNPDVSIYKKGDSFKLITADVTGYIQASGRTSRLYVGGLSKGLSYLLVDSQKAFHSLQKKVRWFSQDIVFKRADEVDLQAIFAQIDQDRKKIRLALEGKLQEKQEFFTTSLIVVESPNKARTIANFYGRPMVRDLPGVRVYEVAREGKMLSIAASKGHVVDLEKQEGIYGVLKQEHFIPLFEPLDENRLEIIKTLRHLGYEVKELYIATDPDTEGEKISYDLCLNIRPFNGNIKRAEFHEVTRWAFDAALDNPRKFDENLVKAQLVRRIADRWIGFSISQRLQKSLGKKWLSAGRVQSAVLEWIVLREYEAKQKVYEIKVRFGGLEAAFIFEKKQEAQDFFDKLQEVVVRVSNIEQKELFRSPFSTDAMLYAASNELHFSPQKTMQLAQDLFEAGFITYHRTDSIRVSPAGINVAKEYILSHFGEEYFSPHTHAKDGGAHEAIRPTRPMDAEDLQEFLQLQNSTLTPHHLRLYDLIFRNFIASQMRPAVVEEVHAQVQALDKTTEVGFFSKIVKHGIDLIVPIAIHTLQEGRYSVEKELITRPKVPRYSYAEVIRMMKERGIGRPSTYAITIEKLEERHYIVQRRGVLYATKLGTQVYEELRNDPKSYAFVNERYTRELEGLMDKVQEGKADFYTVLNDLYVALQDLINSNVSSNGIGFAK
ncbi:reverse gyrase [Nitratiruptor sp. YY09-18]|uniref:reverse gyrase n=1 Tax=Nitratiruptor sp. YY09-18 TaxID=2724901 RepID=UPI0019164C20|nr:reverse gyrase [Nitratiruptor sp. YY09-18]BCD68844.1 reverse gyrase [Nitratiruptor sp. YY09-18]